MGRVGPLLTARLEEATVLQRGQERREQAVLGLARAQPGAEFAQEREIKPGIGQFEPEGVLPVEAGADGIGRLAVRDAFGELQHRDERQPPRRIRGLSSGREQVDEILIGEEGAQRIPHGEVPIAARKGGAGGRHWEFAGESIAPAALSPAQRRCPQLSACMRKEFAHRVPHTDLHCSVQPALCLVPDLRRPAPLHDSAGHDRLAEHPVSVCRVCGQVTHDPVIRLDLPAAPAPAA